MYNFAIYNSVNGLIKIEYKNEYLIGLRIIKDYDCTNYGEKTKFTQNVYEQLC